MILVIVQAIAISATIAVARAQPQTQTTLPEPTVWDHNGSVLYLVAKDSSREIHYQKPRSGMLEAGARPGSLLFRGEIKNGQYLGTAYIFNTHCGPIPFEVTGPILDDDDRIVLTGEAPRVRRNCRTYGSYTSTLEFRRAKLDETDHSKQALTGAPSLVIASKPELKTDVSPHELGEVPSPPTAQLSTKDETPPTAKLSSPGLVDSTGSRISRGQLSVPNEAQQENLLNRYLSGAGFIVMVVWLLIKLFGKSLIGMK